MAENDDHLDKETSVSGELTPTGVKFGAKSRFVAAIDRLGGNIVETMNVPLEARNRRARSVAEGETKLIEAAVEYGISQLGASPELAERAFKKHFRKVLASQDNSDGVIREAIEDLRQNPPSEEQSADPSPISEEFLENLERYSEGATTEELRSRWGRVLAAEVRAPGTFSSKVLRVVDELGPDTAALFEKISGVRLGNSIPFCLLEGGELPFAARTQLTDAGLLVDPGISGQVRKFTEGADGGGRELWVLGFGDVGVAIRRPTEKAIATGDSKGRAIILHKNKPAMPCYLFTNAGTAIATILPDRQVTANAAYVDKVAEQIGIETIEMRKAGDTFAFTRSVPARADKP